MAEEERSGFLNGKDRGAEDRAAECEKREKSWYFYFPISPFTLTIEREAGDKGWKDRDLLGKFALAFRIWLKWAMPMFLCGLCTYLCMVLLHIGTWYYVNQMELQTKLFDRVATVKSEEILKAANITLSIGWREDGNLTTSDGRAGTLSWGSLNDPLHSYLGFKQVDIGFLDTIAAAFPALFCLMAVLMDELGVWTKVMICNALLALGKGLFGVMTTVPDSKGWFECRERLNAGGIDWMKTYHSWTEFFYMEAFGTSQGQRLRWCADMMYSGHTYFTTLYALGLYELSFYFTREWPRLYRMLFLFLVIAVTMGEQIVEVYFVLLNRFHYTMDVVMAILLTFLFFTNSAIAEATKKWVFAFCAKKGGLKKWTKEEATKVAQLRKQLVDDNQLPRDVVFIQMKELRADADIMVPPCCNPCCCCNWAKGNWGGTRHHSFDSSDLGDMLFSLEAADHHELASHMRLSLTHDIRGNVHYENTTDTRNQPQGFFGTVMGWIN